MGERICPIWKEPTKMKTLILAASLASMLCGLTTPNAARADWLNPCANGACDLAPTLPPAPHYYDDGSAARLEAQAAEQRLELQLQMDSLAAQQRDQAARIYGQALRMR
jgi:hypothetical protein